MTIASRSRLRAYAAAFVAATQFAVVAFGPLVEASEGPSAPSHIEETGTRLHFSHNPDDCAACTAATLVGEAPRPAVPAPTANVHPSATRFVAPAFLTLREGTPKAPRAPPRPAAAR